MNELDILHESFKYREKYITLLEQNLANKVKNPYEVSYLEIINTIATDDENFNDFKRIEHPKKMKWKGASNKTLSKNFLYIYNCIANITNSYYTSLAVNGTDMSKFFSGFSIYESTYKYDEVKDLLKYNHPYDIDYLELITLEDEEDFNFLINTFQQDIFLYQRLSDYQNAYVIRMIYNMILSLLKKDNTFKDNYSYKNILNIIETIMNK